MRINKLMIFGLAAVLCIGANTASAAGLDIQVGPAQLHLQGPPGPANLQRNMFDKKICYAIENHNRLELFVGSKDETSDTETKITVKKVTIDPYLFGIDRGGKPVLQGNVISAEVVKEVTIKYSDATFKKEDTQRRPGPQGPQRNPPLEQKPEPGINVTNVSFIRVLDQTSFDIPKDLDKQLDQYANGNIQIVCSITAFSNQGQNQGQNQAQFRNQY